VYSRSPNARLRPAELERGAVFRDGAAIVLRSLVPALRAFRAIRVTRACRAIDSLFPHETHPPSPPPPLKLRRTGRLRRGRRKAPTFADTLRRAGETMLRVLPQPAFAKATAVRKAAKMRSANSSASRWISARRGQVYSRSPNARLRLAGKSDERQRKSGNTARQNG